MVKLGLIINPLAGIGGAVALKGSDGEATVAEALARGAEKKAALRTRLALEPLRELTSQCQWLTARGEMGADVLQAMGFQYQLVEGFTPAEPTTAADTQQLAALLLEHSVDALVFAGGDGTARDVCRTVGEQVPVLGIPAGVKIHSGVFGITPRACGEILQRFLTGQLVDIREAEVRDLDEDGYRAQQVRAKHFGDMRVLQTGQFVQAVKQGGVESQELVLADMAAGYVSDMEDDVLYLIGSGKTTQAVMTELGLEGTLLGVDAVLDGQLLAQDLTEQDVQYWLQRYPKRRALISAMGGQGHIFGRGNQQFSAAVIRAIGKANFDVMATKTKLTSLQGRPLIVDSSDPELDQAWSGSIEVITGYQDRVIYPVA
ncbi:ATP-NAD kinase [Bacterioplanes sanyensis]|uniref:ATP-NAD kinase family protein n=1 Tax=Bacterioplanes sanyensis TaxID=1249553 RepID=UPI00167BC313|nr:ATP-NAD kinase family protein [Bacterioplanes sanyensis]GGY31912.1 ATP-NAD kinase [Bacterioplanes sanyensis]